jgi:signal transduction histidine kinase
MTTAVLAPRTWAPSTTWIRRPPPPHADRLIVEVATAPDIRGAVERLFGLLRRSGLAGGEWRAPADDGSLQPEVAVGAARGARTVIPLGSAGELVLFGDGMGRLTKPLAHVVPLLRRRWSEEQLATQVALLARRNEALEDFAALVAHELKSPLYAARRQTPSTCVDEALERVDSILELARTEAAGGAFAPPAQCLEEALRDLGPIAAEVVADLPPAVPLPPGALRFLLRNLIGNALSADARNIHVSAVSAAGRWTLLVDDDGVGLDAATGYAAGTRLGLNLCRRLVARFGGVLELTARPRGGTRATLVLAGGVA